MTAYIVPVIFITVLIVAIFKKQDPYQHFIEGSSSAINLIIKIFPYLLTIMMAVEVFRASGLSTHLASFLAPVTNTMGFPKEVTELLLLRPLSGAGSLSILKNIYAIYGADSYIGRCASVIYGSSETIFYLSSIYFSQCKIKNLRYAIPIALISTILGCILGCQLLRFF